MAQELRKLAPKRNLPSPLICPATILVIILIDLTKLPKGAMGVRNASMRPIAAAALLLLLVAWYTCNTDLKTTALVLEYRFDC